MTTAPSVCLHNIYYKIDVPLSLATSGLDRSGIDALRAVARPIYQKALRTGALVRAGQCEACGKVCRPDGHHADYTLPLSVAWLCKSCHGKADFACGSRRRASVAYFPPRQPFNPAARETWGDLLTLPELASALEIGAYGVARQCWLRTFVPAPAFRRPLRWKKADVLRFLDGARKSSAA